MRDFFFFRPVLGDIMANAAFSSSALLLIGSFFWWAKVGDELSTGHQIAVGVGLFVFLSIAVSFADSWFGYIKNSSACKNKAGYIYKESSDVVSSTRLAALNSAQKLSGTVTGLYVRAVNIDNAKYFAYMAARGGVTEHGQEYVERRIEADDVRIFEKDDATEVTLKTIEDKVTVTRISDGVTRTITDRYRAFVIPVGSISRSVSVS